MNKILLICNESNSVINFRRELINFLIKNKNDISVIAGDECRRDEIEKLGVNFYYVPFNNRGKNPFELIKTKTKFVNVIKNIKPDTVFTFQIKPNILGACAAHKCHIANLYCMIEGLGDPFQPTNIKGKILRKIVCILYKHSLKHAKKVFVLNGDDKKELIARRVAKDGKMIVIPGIGIDTTIYVPEYNLPKDKKVLMLARLIKNKGIFDYCEIAREVRKTRPDIVFELYGEESQLKKNDIQVYIDDGSIFYGGFNNNVSDLIKNSRVLSSSSYREGFPRVILEGMALGRAVIATDTVGNKDAVVDGKTGYLVPMHDIKTFANKIIEIIDNDELLIKLGMNGRKICEEKYDSKIINDIIYNIIR